MPSIEFLGYDEKSKTELESELREDLSDLDFKHEIVFVNYHSSVISFSNETQSYLRVCTRNEPKAKILLDRLKKYADVEFLKSNDIVFKTS